MMRRTNKKSRRGGEGCCVCVRADGVDERMAGYSLDGVTMGHREGEGVEELQVSVQLNANARRGRGRRGGVKRKRMQVQSGR